MLPSQKCGRAAKQHNLAPEHCYLHMELCGAFASANPNFQVLYDCLAPHDAVSAHMHKYGIVKSEVLCICMGTMSLTHARILRHA